MILILSLEGPSPRQTQKSVAMLVTSTGNIFSTGMSIVKSSASMRRPDQANTHIQLHPPNTKKHANT